MRPINLTEPMPTEKTGYQPQRAAVWMLAFRPFFLGGSILALLSISYWSLLLGGQVSWPLNIPAMVWHAHEMMFGFASVIAMGFLLTAAQTWTGVPSISKGSLMMLTSLWLIARVMFFVKLPMISPIGADLNLYLVILFQGAWWGGGILTLSRMLVKARNKQNYPFIGILTILFGFNMLFLYLVSEQQSVLALKVCDASVFAFTLLIGIVAGRVIPFFTARGLLLSEQVKCPRLDRLIWIVTLVVIISFIGKSLFSIDTLPGGIIAILAFLHLLRSVFWWRKEIINVPLLWSLQLAYFALGVGLAFIALSFFNTHIFFKDALHLITIGSIGMMIMSMMARVSLGHTGRPLKTPYFVNLAFVLIFCSAVSRSLLPLFINVSHAWLLSGVLWSLGFILFLFHYFPILINKRIDGRLG
ncbi:NnrS family protein [Shewanella surugensis]|uniref:NnrS family protein n=1 Tax=Shewanella surugensis TaxID=212020 RepID=A0ABT0LAD7_9GAMM|nr:NnrS family protein [Shewanella surugensis]MCL1124524.1 NnrS family protein [Shewanella surugensis]